MFTRPFAAPSRCTKPGPNTADAMPMLLQEIGTHHNLDKQRSHYAASTTPAAVKYEFTSFTMIFLGRFIRFRR